MKRIKINTSAWLENPKKAMILSFVIAVVAWFIVATVLSPETRQVISDVPVEILLETITTENNLEVIGNTQHTVDITVIGKRYKVGALTPEDFQVTASSRDVQTAGTFSLAIRGALRNPDEEISIESISPTDISVTFDTIVSKEFPLEVDIENIRIADGYMMGTTVYSIPEQLTITGPERDVSQIARCVITPMEEIRGTLTDPLKTQGKLVLYDKDNNILDLKSLTYSAQEYSITVPVYKIITVPLRFTYTNLPAGFPVDELQYTMSADEITVAVPAGVEANIESFSLGNIDFRNMDTGYTVVMDVGLPAGYLNLDQLDQVTIKFETDDYAVRTFTVNIDANNVINAPADYDIQIVSTKVMNVRVVGEPEIVENLTSADLTAVIDLANENIVEGQSTVPVRIEISESGVVWAVGSKSAVIRATAKD